MSYSIIGERYDAKGNLMRDYLCDTAADLPPSSQCVAGSTAYIVDEKKTRILNCCDEWCEQPASGGSGGINPTGTIEITENREYDVTEKAVARVSVPPYLSDKAKITSISVAPASAPDYDELAVTITDGNFTVKKIYTIPSNMSNITPDIIKAGENVLGIMGGYAPIEFNYSRVRFNMEQNVSGVEITGDYVLIERSNTDVQTQEQINNYFNSNWNNGYRHGVDTMALLEPAWILTYDIIVKQNTQFILWFPDNSGCQFGTTSIAGSSGSGCPCPTRSRVVEGVETTYSAWLLTVANGAATSSVNITKIQ